MLPTPPRSLPSTGLAAEHANRLDGLLLDSPFLTGSRSLTDAAERCVLPALLIHQTDDRIIPVSGAQILYDICGSESKRLVKINGAGHNAPLLKEFGAYRMEIRTFVGWTAYFSRRSLAPLNSGLIRR